MERILQCKEEIPGCIVATRVVEMQWRVTGYMSLHVVTCQVVVRAHVHIIQKDCQVSKQGAGLPEKEGQ